MSLESVAARRTASPSFSGRSTPVQHVVGGQSGTREDDGINAPSNIELAHNSNHNCSQPPSERTRSIAAMPPALSVRSLRSIPLSRSGQIISPFWPACSRQYKSIIIVHQLYRMRGPFVTDSPNVSILLFLRVCIRRHSKLLNMSSFR